MASDLKTAAANAVPGTIKIVKGPNSWFLWLSLIGIKHMVDFTIELSGQRSLLTARRIQMIELESSSETEDGEAHSFNIRFETIYHDIVTAHFDTNSRTGRILSIK